MHLRLIKNLLISRQSKVKQLKVKIATSGKPSLLQRKDTDIHTQLYEENIKRPGPQRSEKKNSCGNNLAVMCDVIVKTGRGGTTLLIKM